VIPPDTFLVLGVNASGTHDSTRYGLVHINDIVGRVVWPDAGESSAPGKLNVIIVSMEIGTETLSDKAFQGPLSTPTPCEYVDA